MSRQGVGLLRHLEAALRRRAVLKGLVDEVRIGRIIGIPLIVMLVVAGVGLAAPIVQPPELENLVEGHTAFTVIEQVARNAEDKEEYAAAVAVLVREVTFDRRDFRFPGVLWFNDQYLVNPKAQPGNDAAKYRYPCNGAVIAVPSGDPDPTLDPVNTFTQANYVESYRIRDPNEYDWTVDKWMVNGRPVWTVAINNDGTKYHLADDGTGNGCASRTDRLCGGVDVLPWNYDDRPSAYNDSGAQDRRTLSQCTVAQGLAPGPLAGSAAVGDNQYRYPCGAKDTAPKNTCAPIIRYNAVLFFFLADLDVVGATKDHRAGSTDRANDVSGCDEDVDMTMPSYDAWPCPAADDNREGNSHAYNPGQNYPITTYAGRNNHGGSADCTGDAVGDQGCHATRLVDIYYGRAALPTRTLAFSDTEGVTAPYHCHDAPATQDPRTWCNQNDAFEQVGQESP